MSMRKLIEYSQENALECDTPSCNFVMKNIDPNNPIDGKEFINMPCPACGGNLLTQNDYDVFNMMLKTIKWVNRWLGWIAYLIPGKYESRSTVKVHNGIHVVSKKQESPDRNRG